MPNLEIENIPFPSIDWNVAPDPQEIEQLCELADLPLWDKLGWLEEAQLLALSIQEATLSPTKPAV